MQAWDRSPAKKEEKAQKEKKSLISYTFLQDEKVKMKEFLQKEDKSHPCLMIWWGYLVWFQSC